MPNVQNVNGFEFPASPGPPRRKFLSEAAKWAEIDKALASVGDCLGVSDRAFYRNLIGLRAMAMQNERDRGAGSLAMLEEPELSWLDGGPGPSSS